MAASLATNRKRAIEALDMLFLQEVAPGKDPFPELDSLPPGGRSGRSSAASGSATLDGRLDFLEPACDARSNRADLDLGRPHRNGATGSPEKIPGPSGLGGNARSTNTQTA